MGRKCPHQDGGLGRRMGRLAEVELGVAAWGLAGRINSLPPPVDI